MQCDRQRDRNIEHTICERGSIVRGVWKDTLYIRCTCVLLHVTVCLIVKPLFDKYMLLLKVL